MNRLCGMKPLEYLVWHTRFKKNCRQVRKIHKIENRLEKLVTKEYGQGRIARIHHYEFFY